MEKTFIDRLPLTVFRLTPAGQDAVAAYRRQMLEVLDSLDAGEQHQQGTRQEPG